MASANERLSAPARVAPVERFTPEQIRAARAATDARLAPLPGAAAPAAPPTAAPQPTAAPAAAKPSATSRLAQSIKNNPKKAIGGALVATAAEVPAVVEAFRKRGFVEGALQTGRSAVTVGGTLGGAFVGGLSPVPGSQIATVPAGAIGGRVLGQGAGDFIFGEAPQDGAGVSGDSGLKKFTQRLFPPSNNRSRALDSLQSGRVLAPQTPQASQAEASSVVPALARSPVTAQANDATGPTGLGGSRPVPRPVATRAQTPQDVIGNFTGSNGRTRTLTRTQADALAAQLPTFSASPAAPASAPNGNTAAQFTTQRPSSSSIARVERQIDAQIASLGELNMRSKRALVGQLLDAKARLASGQFNTEAGIATTDAGLSQRQASDELSAATSGTNARLGRLQQVVGADGAVRVFDPASPASLTPVTDAAGNPIFTPQRTAADPRVKFENDALLKLIQGQANQTGGEGINEQALQEQIAAIRRLSGGGQSTLQQVGTDAATGKPVFRDTQGNLVTN